MSSSSPKRSSATRQETGPVPDNLDKLKRSRQRLLDLTLRNRLLNFRAGDPAFRDDSKAHKHLPLKGKIDSVWDALVEDGKQIEIHCLSKDQQAQLRAEMERMKAREHSGGLSDNRELMLLGDVEWDDIHASIRGISNSLQRGNLISLLHDETFSKRIKKIRQEQNTLIDSTGDSALFLALGFLEWSEVAPHPKAGQPLFAPLVLVHSRLEETRSSDGGRRQHFLEMDLDQPQDNPCLAEKLRQDFSIDLPSLDDDDTVTSYLAKVRKALRTKKDWVVHDNIALGFFNFARYRLWLDLDPNQWPEGTDPTNHKIVTSILNGEWLEQQGKIPSDDEVAEHQQVKDLPLVLDADSTQYASILAAVNGTSMVVVGPPGSGKSQTITNLIAVAMNEGKKVLFVAQKLAALSVVHRRLEQSGLKAFCLPIFSDKARVTEVHKHLALSLDARKDSSSGAARSNPNPAASAKLNAHAIRLREVPAGHSDNNSSIIRLATALMMKARDAWGASWDERLLEIVAPDGQPGQEWIARREQTLYEWHRLKTEVGDSWHNWTPVKLGPLDTSKVETACKRQENAARELAAHLSGFPRELHGLTTSELVTLITRISRSKLAFLDEPLQSLVEFLWINPANQPLVARLERDLEELERHRSKAETHLRFTSEARQKIVERAREALSVLNGVLSPQCSIQRGHETLQTLSQLLKSTEDVVVRNGLMPSGILALKEKITPGIAEVVTWKHLELLTTHPANVAGRIPNGTNLRLARHVLEDQSRAAAARQLAEQIASYQNALAYLSGVFMELEHFRNYGDRGQMEATTQNLVQAGFSAARLKQMAEVGEIASQINVAIATFDALAGEWLTPRALCEEAFTLKNIFCLSRMPEIPDNTLWPPTDVLPELIACLDQASLEDSKLQKFQQVVEQIQERFDALRVWFSWLRTTPSSNESNLTVWRNAVAKIEWLGVGSVKLNLLEALQSKASLLSDKLKTASDALGTLWDGISIARPLSIEDLRSARQIVVLLANPPPFPAAIPIEHWGSDENVVAVNQAISESATLNDFRSLYGSRIAFRDIPSVDEIARLRRDLRSYVGKWWRWFSGPYRKVRHQVCAFLNPPFPKDADALTLLDKLESHERTRQTFDQVAIKALFGEFFHGIDTDWKQIEPFTCWIHDLIQRAKLKDVSLLIRLATKQADVVNNTLEKLDAFLAQWDTIHQDLGSLKPIQANALNESMPIAAAGKLLDDIAVSLASMLHAECKGTIEKNGEQTGSELLSKFQSLVQFQAELLAATRNDQFLKGTDLGAVDRNGLATTAKWLNSLISYSLDIGVVQFLSRNEFAKEKVRKIASAANEMAAHIRRLTTFCDEQCQPSWLAGETLLSALKDTFHEVVRASMAATASISANDLNEVRSLGEVEKALVTLAEIEILETKFKPWESILLDDVKALHPEDLNNTLDFLSKLRKAGASGQFLAWMLDEETESRLNWWLAMVESAKALKARIRKLQNDFLTPLEDGNLSLDGWVSNFANRCALMTTALEVIDSISQSGDYTLNDFSQATASLSRALEIEERIQEWKPTLGVEPIQLTSHSVARHRHWVTSVQNVGSVLGAWLAQDACIARTKAVLDLDAKHEALEQAIGNMKSVLTEFGPISARGPFDALNNSGTPHEITLRVQRLISCLPLLPAFAALLRERSRAEEFGLAGLVMVAESCPTKVDQLIDTFRAGVAWQQAKAVWESDEGLRLFSSSEFELLRKKFKTTDKNQLEQNQKHIARRLSRNEITGGITGRFPKDLSDFQLLQHEFGKKRKHLPIRKLVSRAGGAMQDLCPCWMMTPLSVAQFLPAGAIDFDLIIMDEASQLNPEDTWGAIARGKQLVVVGDPKQMPPSDFFSSTLEEDETIEEDDDVDGGKAESILEAAVLSLQNSWLEWHYRSRQETLIAPANQFSYGNRLVLFPNSHQNHPDLGIRYTFVEGAITTTGKVINAKEADLIANRIYELAIAQYRKKPEERLSVGVVAMNIHQQEAIYDLVENLRRNDSQFDRALAVLESETTEPFFIKNLENIQGDERDVMIISCTYGPQTPGGTPTQRFGPLNREGGERRFNVLITRAKCRMEIFSSIKSQQIITEGKRRGVQDFHFLLKYCETGRLDEAGEKTGRGHDSPFEEQVEAVLRSAGFIVEHQIGVAGYFIDLAVRHPRDNGRFAIGVECDGKTYHSSRAARDRDRLREQVLAERGWTLHRIWSTDWFVNHQQARANLLRAVATACD